MRMLLIDRVLANRQPVNRGAYLTILIVLALLLASTFFVRSALPTVHAASPTLTVLPSSGAYSNRDDQTPIAVNGTHFANKETVNIYWNYTGPSTGTLVATASTNTKGAFQATFLTQLAATGTYTIAGIGQTSGLIATSSFTQYPQLYMRPQASGPHSNTTFYGNAFGAGEQVNVYWQYRGPGTGTFLTTATANDTGSFSVTATVPAQNPGPYTAAAVGQTTNTVATYKFTLYQPTFMLAPLSGSASSTITVSGFGFTNSENVAIYWNHQSNPLTTLSTTPYGHIVPTTIAVPQGSSPGAYQLTAVGQSSNVSVTNTFTVLAPGSSLSASSGPVSAKVDVRGTGYTSGATIDILWNYTGPGTGTIVAQATASSAGSIQASFQVPDAPDASYQVAALDTMTQNVTQNTFTLNSSIAVNPSTGTPDQQVTIIGSGYQSGETVNLYLDSSSSSLLATSTVDTNGDINKTVTIPALTTPGSHTFIAVGQTSGRSFTTPITIDTSWGDFGFDYAHHRDNIHEHTLGISNVAQLQLKWTAQTLTGLKDSPVYASGVLYIGSMDGKLDAYNADTGKLKWEFNCQCIFRSFSSPLVDPANNLVFFGTVGHSNEGIPSPIYAIDTRTGQVLWSEILAWETVGFPTLAFNKLFLGTSHIDHNACSLVAIDELTGHIDWQYVINSGVWGAVAADTSTNTVFTGVGNPLASVMAFNSSTGAVVWQYNVPQFGPDDDIGSGITVSNGLVYASSKNGYVYALNENDGTLNWSTAISAKSAGNISTQAVSASGAKLFVGSDSGNLYSLDAISGKIYWKVTTGKRIFSSPALANGVVYFSSFDQKLYVVSAATGNVLWTYTMGAPSFSSPIVVNGWVYCAASDGKLYAFSL